MSIGLVKRCKCLPFVSSVFFFLLLFSLFSSVEGQESLSLEDLLEIASEHSLSLRQKELNLRESMEHLLRLEANYPLHTTRRALKGAQDDLFRLREDLELSRMDLKREVLENYFEVLKAEDLIQLQEKALEDSLLQMETAKTRLDQGLITPLEFQSFEHRYQEALFQVKQAKDGLELSLLQLCQTLGLDLREELSLQSYDPVLEESADYVFEVMLEKALEHRYEITLARKRVEDLALDRERIDSEYYSLSELKEVELQLSQAEIELENLERSLYLEIWQLHNQLENSSLQMDLKEQELKRVKEEHRLAKEQYRLGRISSQELFTSHQRELQVETELITLIYDDRVLKTRLQRALGSVEGSVEEGVEGAP